MNALVRLGRGIGTRLRSMSRRQTGGGTIAGVLCAATVASALTGHAGWAMSPLAVLVTVTLVGVLLLAGRISTAQRANQAIQRDLRVTVDQMHRRLVAASERERRAAQERQQVLADTLARNQQLAKHDTDLLLRAQSREMEALVQLFQTFTPRAPMPSSGDFALNPTDLLELIHLIRTRQPKLVLELGSGTSSVWIAYALEHIGGRLVSLEHDRAYADRTRAVLAAHGLTAVAEVRDAPLQPVVLGGRSFSWYDVGALADLHDIDLLLIDGPPEKTGPDARYPALLVIEGRLAATATILLDDANRRSEQDAMRQWTETITGLSQQPELLGRHAVLTYVRAGNATAPVPS